MKKLFILIVGLLIFTSLANAQVSDAKSKKILNKVSKKLKEYSTIKIKFTFTEKKDGAVISTKKGLVWAKKKKYYLKFAGQTVYCNGKTKWTYIKDSEEVHITDVKNDDEFANPLNLLTNYTSKFNTRWIREEKYKENTVIVIDLYPKKDNKSYHRIRLRINKANNRIASTSIHYMNKTSQTFDITSFKTNEAIPDSKFTWNSADHPDVEEIDLRD